MWIYNGKVLSEIPTGAVGFVYIIHRENLDVDVSSPIKYIGKKNFYAQKGKKESDWKKYYGSSEWLKKHVNRYTEDVFRREILRICYSKSEMTYHEVMLQISEDVGSPHNLHSFKLDGIPLSKVKIFWKDPIILFFIPGYLSSLLFKKSLILALKDK